MKNKQDNFYSFSPENRKDEKYDEAVKHFSKDTLVYLKTTGQVGMVEEVKTTADGLAVRVVGVGLVPVDELRRATDEEIEKSKFNKGK